MFGWISRSVGEENEELEALAVFMTEKVVQDACIWGKWVTNVSASLKSFAGELIFELSRSACVTIVITRI